MSEQYTLIVQVVRTFAKLREILSTHHELRKKIEEMERKYDAQFNGVFEAIRRLIDKGDNEPPRRIGFGVN